jgi:antirestriction protein ArdC
MLSARTMCASGSDQRPRAANKGSKSVPFRDHATSFTPEQLDVLTTAFYAAMAELSTAGVEISQPDLANRILDRAADGVFDVGELKRAALNGWISSGINEST